MEPTDDDHAGLLLATAGVTAATAAAPLIEWRRSGAQFTADQSARGSAEVTGNGAQVRFECRAGGDLHHVRLSIPALPGRYVFSDLQLDHRSISDPWRHVTAAHESWERQPDAALAMASVTGRPSIELDLRAFCPVDDQPARPRFLSVLVKREQCDPRADERIAGDLAQLRTAVRQLQVAHARLGMGQMESLERQSERVAAQAVQQALESADERRVVMARLDALAASFDRRADESNRIVAGQQALSDRLDEFDRRMQVLAIELREAQQAAADTAARALVALEDDRRADRAERQQTRDLLLGSTSALSADIRDLRSAVDTVFWRRWLRSMRPNRSES